MVFELLSYSFMQRAALGGIAIALVCSLIGPFLVLRRLSLLGDGLAHVALGGIALGLLIGVHPVAAALLATSIGSLVVYRLIRTTRIHGDAATAIVLSGGVGVAVVVLGITRGFTVDLFSYLFGSILALSKADLALIAVVLVAVVLFVYVYYRELVFMSFHEDLAELSGVKSTLVSSLFAVMTALAVVVSIRAVGVLLVSALLVIPALTALMLAKSFKATMGYSVLVSVCALLAGIILAFLLNLPPGGLIVLTLLGIFISVLIAKR